jgi:oligopeptide/dipeptide ABC transporter ATP-binding protein
MADHIAVMYAGRMVEFGRTGRLLHEPRHPYPAALLESSVRTARPGERLRVIEGQPPALPGTFTACAFAPRCPAAQQRCLDVEPRYDWPADEGVACHFPRERRS